MKNLQGPHGGGRRSAGAKPTSYAEMRPRFDASPFRSRFRLTREDRAYLAERGWPVVRAQAEKILRERLAPAHPARDGRQTPMRGHVVFTAQHATATCCRGCLARWHDIPAGRALTEAELRYVTEMVMGFLTEQAGDLTEFPVTPELFPPETRQ